MIITTTNSLEGKKVIEYKTVIFAEVVVGVDFIKDFKAGLTNIFGGRSGSYENELIQARDHALRELQEKSKKLGANAILGVNMDYETIGTQGNNMLVVIASGTAVVVE